MVQVVQHHAKGKIVVAAEDIPAGVTVISSCIRDIAPGRDSHTVQIGPDTHIHLDDPANYLSHGCQPNLAVRDNERGAFDFFTLAPVEIGTELCFHYAMTETEICADLTCLCGSNQCLGRIAGFWELPSHLQQWLYEMGISAYLRGWHEGSCAPADGVARTSPRPNSCREGV